MCVCVCNDPQEEGLSVCRGGRGGHGSLLVSELALVALVSLMVLKEEEEEEAVMKGSPVHTVLLT